MRGWEVLDQWGFIASYCQKCGPAKFSSSGASYCSECKAGKYSTTGASYCEGCEAGKYSTTGASYCEGCEAATMQWQFCLPQKAILVLPIALVRLSKLYWHGAKNVLSSCAGHLAHLSTQFCSAGGCARITTTLGQLPWCKMILNREGAEQKSEAAKL